MKPVLPIRLCAVAIALLLSVLTTICLPTLVAAQCSNACVANECPRDIWLIDTRDIGECDCDLAKAKFWRLEGNCNWIAETETSFLSTLEPSSTINLQLPGYLTSEKLSIEHLWKMRFKVEEQAKCRGLGCPDYRSVMWLWPSTKNQFGIVRDTREKAERANFEGILLAKFLAKFPGEIQVNLVGYSLGARIATSAAHHLALGGPLTPTSKVRLTAVLIAAAVDAEWLDQCQPHSLALQRFERALIFTNCKDRLLLRYRFINRNRNSPALGLAGLLMPNSEGAAHVTQWEVHHFVGRHHNWLRYIETPEIMSAIAEYALFLHDTPTANVPRR